MFRKAIYLGAGTFFVLLFLNAIASHFFKTGIINQSKQVASISGSFAEISEMKIRISEYYNNYGRLPDTNEEIGLGEPASRTSHWISSVTIGPLGQIDVALKDAGEKTHLYVTPVENLSEVGKQLVWKCFARGIHEDILAQIHSPVCQPLDADDEIPGTSENKQQTASVDDLVNAVYAKRGGLIKSLLSQKINVNGRNKLGESPLRAAIERGMYTSVTDLIAAGADVNEVLPTQERKTLLMHASERRNYRAEKMRALLSAGANIEARDAHGKTALMYAAISDDLQAARILMQHGADKTAIDNKGQTAANYAVLMHGSRSSMAQLLIEDKDKEKTFIYRLPEE